MERKMIRSRFQDWQIRSILNKGVRFIAAPLIEECMYDGISTKVNVRFELEDVIDVLEDFYVIDGVVVYKVDYDGPTKGLRLYSGVYNNIDFSRLKIKVNRKEYYGVQDIPYKYLRNIFNVSLGCKTKVYQNFKDYVVSNFGRVFWDMNIQIEITKFRLVK